ncbi:DUF805 domain-containing protein [Gymnodinialimonas sp.]
MLNFSGRARRAEYWWFMLWTIFAGAAMGAAIGFYAFSNPEILSQMSTPKTGGAANFEVSEQIQYYAGYYFAANLILFWLPGLAVTIRRLHDTNRSGAWYFIQLVPLIGVIWFLVLMCLPGTHGNNRFGPDSAPDRKRPSPAHPAFAGELSGEERDRAEIARRAAAKDYYKRHVLPSIQNA